jgi:uncharacterized protein YndB with AHSA1/START domain
MSIAKRLLKAMLGAAALMGLLAGVAALLGSRLPREHRVASSILVPAEIETVWQWVSDPEGQAAWNADIQSVETAELPDGQTLITQKTSFGDIPVVVRERTEPTRFKTEIYGEAMGWGGSWTWTLEPASGGTRVTILEEGFVEGAIMRFLSAKLMGQHMAMDGSLVALASHAGAAEAVPQHLDK